MMARKIPITLLLTMMVLSLSSCCCGDRIDIDVYINDDCNLQMKDDPTKLDPFIVQPGAFVYFNNLTQTDVQIALPPAIFKPNVLIVPGNGMAMTEVVGEVDDEDAMSIVCTGKSGNPKVRVGKVP